MNVSPWATRRVPHDLLLRCHSFLEYQALCRLACASAFYRKIAGDNELWRRLFASTVPCQTAFDTGPSWQHLLRLYHTKCTRPSSIMSRAGCAEKCWFKVVWKDLEVPVPYSSSHSALDLLVALIALLCPDDREFQAAVLRRFDGNIPGAVLAETTGGNYSACSKVSLLEPLNSVSSSPNPLSPELSRSSIAHLNLPRVLRVQLSFGKLEELQKEGVFGFIMLNVWTSESVVDGEAQRVWVCRADTLSSVKERLSDVTGVPVHAQRLFVMRSHHGNSTADSGDAAHSPPRAGTGHRDPEARVGGQGRERREPWARGLAAIEVEAAEEGRVGSDLWWSSGEHVVVRDVGAGDAAAAKSVGAGRDRGVQRRALAGWRRASMEGEAGPRGLGRMRCWVNEPGTLDYSVLVWVDAGETVGGLRRRVRAEARLGLQQAWGGDFTLWSAGRELADDEQCRDVGLAWRAGGEGRVRVTSPGWWDEADGGAPAWACEGGRRGEERAAGVGGGVARHVGVDSQVWGSEWSATSEWEALDWEAELLAERAALRPESLAAVLPALGSGDSVRQLEFCPHAPGVLLAGGGLRRSPPRPAACTGLVCRPCASFFLCLGLVLQSCASVSGCCLRLLSCYSVSGCCLRLLSWVSALGFCRVGLPCALGPCVRCLRLAWVCLRKSLPYMNMKMIRWETPLVW